MARQEESPKKKTIQDKIAELEAKRTGLELGGGKDRIDKQHASGKLSARERVAKLVDKESFEEIGLFARHRATYFGMADKDLPADGVVTGCATIEGRLVHLASQDFTVAGGAAGEMHSNKVADMMGMSLKTGSPFIFINDSGGARVQEGIDSLAGYARVFYNNVMLSGTVPQISLICGPCAGGAAYSPALTDFVIQTQQGRMFITGPQVIKQVTGEVVTRGRTRRPAGADEQLRRGAPDRADRRRSHPALPPPAQLHAFQQPRRPAPHGLQLACEGRFRFRRHRSRRQQDSLRRPGRHCACRRLSGFSRDSAWLRGQHRHRLSDDCRAVRWAL